MTFTGMPTRALPRPLAGFGLAAAFGVMTGFVGGGRSLLGLLAQLLDHRQVALAYAVDEALERQISNAHQPEVTVFTVKQTPGDRLIEVLKPMHANNRR